MAGTALLLRNLPAILDGSANEKAKEQDPALATSAPKVLACSASHFSNDAEIVLVMLHVSDACSQTTSQIFRAAFLASGDDSIY